MSKLLVTNEQMKAFEELTTLELDFGEDETPVMGKWTPEGILKEHVENGEVWHNSFAPLNTLSLKTLSAMLYFPEMIEIKKTPEQELLEIFNKESDDRTEKIIDEYISKGIKIALDTLDIKIKGINA